MFRNENFIGQYSAAVIHKREIRSGDALLRGLFTYGIYVENGFYKLPPEEGRQLNP